MKSIGFKHLSKYFYKKALYPDMIFKSPKVTIALKFKFWED